MDNDVCATQTSLSIEFRTIDGTYQCTSSLHSTGFQVAALTSRRCARTLRGSLNACQWRPALIARTSEDNHRSELLSMAPDTDSLHRQSRCPRMLLGRWSPRGLRF